MRWLVLLYPLLVGSVTQKWTCGDGRWSQARCWSQGVVPRTGDDVVIAAHTVTIDVSIALGACLSVNTLTLGSASSTIQARLVSNYNFKVSQFTWNTGVLLFRNASFIADLVTIAIPKVTDRSFQGPSMFVRNKLSIGNSTAQISNLWLLPGAVFSVQASARVNLCTPGFFVFGVLDASKGALNFTCPSELQFFPNSSFSGYFRGCPRVTVPHFVLPWTPPLKCLTLPTRSSGVVTVTGPTEVGQPTCSNIGFGAAAREVLVVKTPLVVWGTSPTVMDWWGVLQIQAGATVNFTTALTFQGNSTIAFYANAIGKFGQLFAPSVGFNYSFIDLHKTVELRASQLLVGGGISGGFDPATVPSEVSVSASAIYYVPPPTQRPTRRPTTPTLQPTRATNRPTTRRPTNQPTNPTQFPTRRPSITPTQFPTRRPSITPTQFP